MSTILVVDIETVPAPHVLTMPAPEDWLNRGIQANWKPETVERYRAEALASWGTEVIKRGSLDWRLGQIVSVGWVWPDRSPVTLVGDEGSILNDFWDVASTAKQVVGFNLRNFDWPWLLGRSAFHRLPVPKRFNSARYTHTELVDWADILSHYGAFSLGGWTLEQYAMAFNLPHRTVGSGSDVYGWWQAGNTEAIRQHLAADLLTTQDLDRVCRPSFLGAA